MPPVTGNLWHGNLKINTERKGFNFKFHMALVDEATARANALDIAARFKKIMPADASIFFATINKDDSKKDSRFLPDALGPGEYVLPGTTPPPSSYDYFGTALLVRLEHEDGSSVTRKINPLPDNLVEDAYLLSTIAAVTTMPTTIAAPGAGADWYAEMNNLFKALVKNTHHVKSGHEPGGEFEFFPWTAAYPLRIGQKRGGRVFN